MLYRVRTNPRVNPNPNPMAHPNHLGIRTCAHANRLSYAISSTEIKIIEVPDICWVSLSIEELDGDKDLTLWSLLSPPSPSRLFSPPLGGDHRWEL